MTTGSLQKKGKKWYAVICFNVNGKQSQKWISTGLSINGNKKRAEKFLSEKIKEYSYYESVGDTRVLFSDFLINWLEIHSMNIQPSTYRGYKFLVGNISLYFSDKNIALVDLKAFDIQKYYTMLLKRMSPNTVNKYHVVIRLALQYAYKTKLVSENVADLVDRPKQIKYRANYYNKEEISYLLKVIKGNILEVPILFAIYYGLRRSEIIGLKWDAIDFKNRTITIKHKVVFKTVDNKLELHFSDVLKNNSSYRIMPLNDELYRQLTLLKDSRKNNMKMLKNKYNSKFIDYICVHENGDIITPDYLTRNFSKILVDNSLRKIRLHDLRHSCATLLLSLGYDMKQIQTWMGHGDIGTTMNIYAHVGQKDKLNIMNGISSALEA